MRRSVSVFVGVVLALCAIVTHAQQPPAGAPAAPAPASADAPAGRQAGPPAGRGRGGPPARIVTFEARPASIKPGESAMLVWLVENPGARQRPPSGQRPEPSPDRSPE